MQNRRNPRTVDGSVARSPQMPMPMRQQQMPGNAGHPAVKLFLLKTAREFILGGVGIGIVVFGVLSIIDAIQGHPGAHWFGFLAWIAPWLIVAAILGVVVVLCLVVREWIWPFYKEVQEWNNEQAEQETSLKLKTAVVANVSSGFNTKYMNARTSEMMESVNPITLIPASKIANYYGIQQEQEKQQEQLQIVAPEASFRISEDYSMPADDYLSARKLIAGQSDSGKSNSVGVTLEELGQKGAPLVLGDTEDEYEALSLWLPRGMKAGATGTNIVTPDNAYNFGQWVLKEMMQVVLNLQSYEMEEAAKVMIALLEGMRDWQESFDSEDRIPAEFVLEEAPYWLPQNVSESPLHGNRVLNQLQGLFFNTVRRGRKRGIGTTVVCQKVAEIDKRALQANVKLLHYQNEKPDMDVYAGLGITKEETLALGQGDAFLLTSRTGKKRIHVRRRNSPHGANTPGLANLQRHQLTRKLDGRDDGRDDGISDGIWRNSSLPQEGRNYPDAPVEGFRNISEFRRPPQETPPEAPKRGGRGISEEIQNEVERRYRANGKKGRTKLAEELGICHDQFWQVREICDAIDRERSAEGE